MVTHDCLYFMWFTVGVDVMFFFKGKPMFNLYSKPNDSSAVVWLSFRCSTRLLMLVKKCPIWRNKPYMATVTYLEVLDSFNLCEIGISGKIQNSALYTKIRQFLGIKKSRPRVCSLGGGAVWFISKFYKYGVFWHKTQFLTKMKA